MSVFKNKKREWWGLSVNIGENQWLIKKNGGFYMFKKILIVLMIGCFLLGMATRAEAENAVEGETPRNTVTDTLNQPENKSENGYRIEVAKEKLRAGESNEEIRFISPEGNVVKSIPFSYSANKVGDLWHIKSTNLEAVSEDRNKVIISEMSSETRYNPEKLTDYPGYEGEIWDFSVSLMNDRGEVKFAKRFKTYPGDDPTASYWKTLFSKQGNSVLFFYRDSGHVFHVEVYDTKGNKLAEASNENYLRNLQIAPDGKIVGAGTEEKVGKAWLKHLFFLDVETGKTKIAKAEGEVNGKRWSASPSLLKNKKIYLSGGWHYIEKAQSVITSFNEMPSDLSILFGGER
jgi:hypothetical protein